MTKEYSVIQKKLQQLESELQIAFSLPKDTPLPDDIDQRLTFFKHLISSEFESQPEKPQHLNHIDQRIQELKAACHDWNVFRANAVNNVVSDSTCMPLNDDNEAVYEEPEPVKIFNDLLEENDSPLGHVGHDMDSASTCSSTELCMDDDGEDVYAEPESGLEARKGLPLGVVKDQRQEKGGNVNRICKYVGAVFGGGIFGAAMMGYVMVRFSSCFISQVELVGYVAPT